VTVLTVGKSVSEDGEVKFAQGAVIPMLGGRGCHGACSVKSTPQQACTKNDQTEKEQMEIVHIAYQGRTSHLKDCGGREDGCSFHKLMRLVEQMMACIYERLILGHPASKQLHLCRSRSNRINGEERMRQDVPTPGCTRPHSPVSLQQDLATF